MTIAKPGGAGNAGELGDTERIATSQKGNQLFYTIKHPVGQVSSTN
jgi:hypothetical protein